MNNRRRFITLVPFAGATVLAACSKEAPAPAAPPAPAPVPAPAPSPSPSPMSTGSSDGAASSSANLPLLQESDPVAAGLGYVSVASRADRSKYTTWAEGQACGNCALFAGKPGDAQGPCPVFAGKQVLATAWCSAYVKKTG